MSIIVHIWLVSCNENVLENYAFLVYVYYMHPGYQTSICGKNRAYYIRIFTVNMSQMTIFDFQQDCTLARGACYTVQLPQLEILNFTFTELWPQQPGAEAHWLQDLGSLIAEFYNRVNMVCESPVLKKSICDWLKSGKAVMQHLSEKMRFWCFCILPGSAEAGEIGK